jgi:hypothetical protein
MVSLLLSASHSLYTTMKLEKSSLHLLVKHPEEKYVTPENRRWSPFIAASLLLF